MSDFARYDAGPFYGLDDISTFNFGSSVQRIPAYLCHRRSKITSVALPQSLTTIGKYAFAFTGLNGVTIPANVTTIDACPFYGCSSLRTVNFNAVSCKDMGSLNVDNAMLRGTEVTAFNIGSGVKRLPALACYGLTGLTSLSIPAAVTTIGSMAFGGCSGLTSIHPFMQSPASLTYGSGIFDGVDKTTCRLTVPQGTLAQYKATSPWKEFYHISTEGGMIGDVNGDGQVTVTDVTCAYNIILGTSSDYADNADVNGDGQVTVTDITAIYNIILGAD